MNLYRIDLQQPDGTFQPLSDFLGPRLIRSRTAADNAARMATATTRLPAQVTRIRGAGQVTIMGTFQPDGRFTR